MRLFAHFVLVGALLTGCTKDPETDTQPDDSDPGDTDPGDTDDSDACDELVWYADTDGDGFGDDAVTELACERPDGFSDLGGDCDDADDASFPGGEEICDGADNDCDGTADPDDAVGTLTWYADGDGDGYGVEGDTTTACTQPNGNAPEPGDCDDGDPTMNPGEVDDCNGRDDDCDGAIDSDVPDWFEDRDGDGWGDTAASVIECTQPAGYVAEGGDCDEGNPAVNPGATEMCDGVVDEDCDGTVDEDDAADALTWYADDDDDSYGDAASTHVSCQPPSGYVGNDDDCDDGDASLNPETKWYADADKDGYGDPGAVSLSCTQPSGYLADASDCDDGDAAVNPDTIWYADADKDGYGNKSSTTASCLQPSGYVADATDCDDGRSLTNPGATEYCNTYDDDCDATTDEDDAADASTWYRDGDSDGYGVSTTSKKSCSMPTGYAATSTDCDDARAATNPGASEYCNTYDDDCDGSTDESDAVDAKTWYPDADLDGYGSSSTSTKACTSPSGYVSTSTDCDDADEYAYPGAVELCDMAQNDCDATAWTTDDEHWVISLVDDSGVWTDVSDDLLTTATYTLPDGTLYVCHGEYLVSLHQTTSGNKTYVYGPYGTAETIINAAAVDTALYTAAGQTYVEGVTLTNGIGYSSTSTGTRRGGGVYVAGGAAYLTDVIVDANTADLGGGIYAEYGGLSLDTVTVSNNVSDSFGGGMYLNDRSVTIVDSTFSGNTANAEGGGIYWSGGSTGSFYLDVTNSTFSGNTSTDFGGAIYVRNMGTSDLTLDTVQISSNSAPTGGGLYVISYNANFTADIWDSLFDGNAATTGAGGGLYADAYTGTDISVSGSTFSGNTAATYGGGVYHSDGTIALDTTTVSGNDATSAGGGIYLTSKSTMTGTTLTVDSNVVSGSAASTTYYGAGIYVGGGSSASLTSSSVENNSFSSTSTTATQGGGIYANASSTSLTTSYVRYNAAAQGGGIYWHTTSSSSSGAMTNTSVSGNDATTGAGLYVSAGTFSCTGSSASGSYGLTANVATGNGGGVYVSGTGSSATAQFSSTTCDFGTLSLTNNTDSGGTSDAYVGVARYSYGNDQTFTCKASTGSCL
jgi:predicted outer membrane repeat protein